ncbi:MAG: FKBP-type peptidyl-prolyl cis-trans isomerase [Thermoplasmatota archaeon]
MASDLPQDGDVVRFDYDLYVEGSKQLAETSDAEKAQAAGIFNPQRTYRPLTVTLGKGSLIPGLEAHLKTSGAIGDAQKVDIAAEDAYGKRDPSLLKDVPMGHFRKQKVEPELGMRLNLEGKPGTVVRVSGGRVRVDMNHDLAGKALRYEYTVTEILRDDDAKVGAMLGSFFPMGIDWDMDPESLNIQLPQQVSFDQNWAMGKFRVLNELRGVVGDRSIRLVETFPSPSVMEAAQQAAAAAQAAAGGEEE